ncbi:MAG: hypothetical protein ACYSUK_11355, partial [Planctomycetota bacterium]
EKKSSVRHISTYPSFSAKAWIEKKAKQKNTCFRANFQKRLRKNIFLIIQRNFGTFIDVVWRTLCSMAVYMQNVSSKSVVQLLVRGLYDCHRHYFVGSNWRKK